MKVCILAGGLGTRLSEETHLIPKPMVEIGGHPILWHIMKQYDYFELRDFVVLLGYKGYAIKEYFANFRMHRSNVSIDLSTDSIEYLDDEIEPWKVLLLETGLLTQTGGRVLRAREVLGDETFMLTYGDGVSDVNLRELINFHRQHGRTLTVTAVRPEGRYGALEIDSQGGVSSFFEKPPGDGNWVNGGFFVCEPNIFDYLTGGDSASFERDLLVRLAAEGELAAYKHSGYWKCMDTQRDQTVLNEQWSQNRSPWKLWPEAD